MVLAVSPSFAGNTGGTLVTVSVLYLAPLPANGEAEVACPLVLSHSRSEVYSSVAAYRALSIQ
eukprot:2368891-Rhodomonas_salina.4